MRIIFLLDTVAILFFLLNVCFPRHWTPSGNCVRRDVFSVHLAVRIRPNPKNKPEIYSGLVSAPAIYACIRNNLNRPILADQRHGHTLRKLPAFSRNLPLHRIFAQFGRNSPNRRSVRISDYSLTVNRLLHFFVHILCFLFVACDENKKISKVLFICLRRPIFNTNSGGFCPRCFRAIL